MTYSPFRYQFEPDACLVDVECSLLLALWATESLHGSACTELEAAHFLDREQRVCLIDASNEVGETFNKLFVGFLRREFPTGTFRVERVSSSPDFSPETATAE